MIFPNKRPKILLLLWLTALAVAACGGSDGGGSSGFVEGASDFHTPTEAATEEATEEAQEEPASENGAGVNFSLIAAPRRLVIMNADMQLVVSDPGQVMDQIAEMAEAYGGFVVESNLRTIQDQYNRPIPHATITVRVPANRLQQALEEVEASAEEILGKNLSGQDITSQYTDLKSRLRNLENTANQLAVIMEDAKNTDDTLKVYNKLTQVTNDIEVIKGKIQYYEKASAMSVISLVLNAVEMPPPEDPPEEEPKEIPWEPGKVFANAANDLKEELQDWVDGAIRTFIYGLPLLILRLLPVALFFWIGLRWAFRKNIFTRPQSKPEE